jgi:tetratricopeptide (TPR) repeat protein
MSSGDNPQPDLPGSAEPRKSGNGKVTGDPIARHASITELELAFAQDPESTAYVDLCLAYVEQGRFMEAMVVCKKGLKSHPDSIDARVLLARVYAAQKKYKKALQELDELATQQPNAAAVYLARGKMKIEAQDEPGAIADLKKSLDLDKSLAEATKLLADRGIEYPEKPKAPPPPPPAPVVEPTPVAHQRTVYPSRERAGSVTVTPVITPHAPLPRTPSEVHPLDSAYGAIPPDASQPPMPLPRGSSTPYGYAPQYSQAPIPQRLEGEEELEELANQVAQEKPDKGKPKVSLFLAIGMTVLALSLIIYRVTHKATVEAIDRLTTAGIAAFNNDTYGSYKTAAQSFEEILDRHDSSHAVTLGRLAHVYAILWGEHGEVALKDKLDKTLERAEKYAPDVSHTVAARGLAILYDGKDRQVNAAKAQEAVAPIVQKVKELDGAPSYADLTLAIIDLELGNYDSATQTLGNVKQVLPGSVRAKVWHARAAYRASRLGTSEAAFQEALRAQPLHPGARAGLALTKIVRGDLNGAAEQLVKFDELPEKDVSSRDRALAEFARSEVFRAAAEDARALGAYELAIRLDPGNADFPYGRGKSLLESDNAKEALPHLKKAVEMEKTRWTFLVTLAEAEMQPDVEDYKSAEKHVNEALARASSQLEPMLAKARYLRRTRSPETEGYLKKVLEQFPSAEAEVSLELGRYYRVVGKLDEAKTSIETAINKMSGYSPTKQAEIVMSYARLMKDRNESDVAVQSYRQAVQLGSLEASYWLATMLVRGDKGEREEAKRSCERYLAAGASLRYTSEARQVCDQLR